MRNKKKFVTVENDLKRIQKKFPSHSTAVANSIQPDEVQKIILSSYQQTGRNPVFDYREEIDDNAK